jgi:NAD(P)H-flavin reductase
MMRATSGDIGPNSQAGLKDAWKAQGYFLPCVCVPRGDVTVAALDAGMAARSTVLGVDWLSSDVVRLRLSRPDGFDFRAGQYLSLRNPDGLSRSYSIASLPDDGVIDLHVRIYPNGRMGSWIANCAKPGDAVTLTGPFGECFYLPAREQQPLLLIGTGTGLAPLQAILRDALANGHTGPIHLYHGAVTPAGLYLVEELAALASVNYRAVVLSGDAPNVTTGAIDAVALGDHPKLNGWRVFLCGDPALVRTLKKKVFLAGAAMRDIHADAFLPAV